MAQKDNRNNSIIRIILCGVVLAALLLGMFEILPKKIVVPAADGGLAIISIWNGIAYLKDGRKKESVIVFAAAAAMIAMLVISFI